MYRPDDEREQPVQDAIELSSGVASEGNTATTQQPRSRINRRAILRGTMVTVPVVLTLSSGSALARSSNVITSNNTLAGSKDAQDRVLCLDTNTVSEPSAGVYDLGVPPSADVTAITDEKYYVSDGNGGYTKVYIDQVCRDGGTYFKGSAKEQVTVPRGALVSATALQSFAGSIFVTEI